MPENLAPKKSTIISGLEDLDDMLIEESDDDSDSVSQSSSDQDIEKVAFTSINMPIRLEEAKTQAQP